MNIVFEYEGKKLVLPVNPSSVRVTKPSPSQKVEVIGTGEVSVPQKRKLATVSISSFFWADLFSQGFLLSGLGGVASYIPESLAGTLSASQAANWVGGKIAGSALGQRLGGTFGGSLIGSAFSSIIDDSQKFTVLNEYVKWFEEWQASKKPARWTIVVPPNDPPQCFDFYVTCENFSYEIKAGESSDYYYEIELLEWRDYGAKVLNATVKEDGNIEYNEQPNARLDVYGEIVQEVDATDKDSIWSITAKYCKNNWKDFVSDNVNKIALSNSPQNIAGMTLKIPKQYINRTIS